MYSEDDQRFMSLALMEARVALGAGDYPVGAALVVDGELWGTARNSLFSDARTTAHAEHNLLHDKSMKLRARKMTQVRTSTSSAQGANICLYTTLEPCLMCLGTAVLHGVSRIVIACPDPNGGTTSLDVSSLGSFYRRWWPAIQIGLYKAESCDLIIEFLKTEKFNSRESMLNEFQALRELMD